MKVLSEDIAAGVRSRRFDLPVEGSDGDELVPGLHWVPEADGPVPATVCIGHGGFQHKNYGNVPELAVQLVQNLGIAVVALDAPGHGDRMTDPEAAKRRRKAMAEAAAAGETRALDPEVVTRMQARAQRHVDEWRVLVDTLVEDPRWSSGPFGWWGVSMGTTHGIPTVAQDERFRAAVFGLNALGPGSETMAAHAASITVPVLFLLQSEDELMTRDAGLALWDALGSKRKTLHLNPGGHVQVPRFERDSSEAFFRRHLLEG